MTANSPSRPSDRTGVPVNNTSGDRISGRGYAYCPKCNAMNAVFTPDHPEDDLQCLVCDHTDREPDLDWGD